jgi:hypothetical protein
LENWGAGGVPGSARSRAGRFLCGASLRGGFLRGGFLRGGSLRGGFLRGGSLRRGTDFHFQYRFYLCFIRFSPGAFALCSLY